MTALLLFVCVVGAVLTLELGGTDASHTSLYIACICGATGCVVRLGR
jgi:hypothetical protein